MFTFCVQKKCLRGIFEKQSCRAVENEVKERVREMSFLTACTPIATLALAAASAETTIPGFDCNFVVRSVPGGRYQTIPDLCSGQAAEVPIEPFQVMVGTVTVGQWARYVAIKEGEAQVRRAADWPEDTSLRGLDAIQRHLGGRDLASEAPAATDSAGLVHTNLFDRCRYRPGWLEDNAQRPITSLPLVEAQAFAQWATRQTGVRARVPSYEQWAAARFQEALKPNPEPAWEWTTSTIAPVPFVLCAADLVVVSGAWRVHEDRSGSSLPQAERQQVVIPMQNLDTGFRLVFHPQDVVGRTGGRRA